MTKEEFMEKCRAAEAAHREKARRYMDIVMKKAVRILDEKTNETKEQYNTQKDYEHIS